MIHLTVTIQYKISEDAEEVFWTDKWEAQPETGGYPSEYSTSLTENEPELVGCRFVGWKNTIDDENIKINENNITVYRGGKSEWNIVMVAQWEALPTVTLVFVYNDGVTKDKIETITQESANELQFSFTVPEVTRENYKLDGWQWNNTGHYSEYTYKMNWDLYAGQTLKFEARWIEYTNVTLTFMDGSEMIKQDKLHWKGTPEDKGFTVTFPEVTAVQGYEFAGWHCSKDGKIYNNIDTVSYEWAKLGAQSSEIIFTAQWQGKDETLQADTEYYLKPGFAYTISEGTWKVNSDGYSYNIGENFFVTTAGNYTFTK